MARIFKIKIIDDKVGQFALWLAVGLVYAFLVSFIGIILGLSIVVLTWTYLISMIAFFIVAMVLESRLPTQKDESRFDLKLIFRPINLVYVLAFAIAFLLLLTLIKSGSFFKGGDVNYHLAIINKVINGQPLSISNLSYVRYNLNIAYGFPIWHVFLAMLAVITKANFLAIWKDMTLVLTALSFITWFWFSRKIFVNTIISTMTFILFMIISFYWGGGYLFSTLPIPHSLSQVILVPLIILLSLEFFTRNKKDGKPNYPLFVIILLSALFFGAVHITSYFYYLFVIVSYAVFDLIFNFRTKGFWKRYEKVLLLICSSIAVIIPLAIALELKDNAISSNFKSFNAADYPTTLSFNSFVAYGPFLKYAFLGLPLVLFFLRKNNKLLILLAVFLLIPFVYFAPIGQPLIRLIGYIFVKRLIGTLDWSWLVWGLVSGFSILLITKPFGLIKSKIFNYFLYIFAFALTSFAIFWQFKTDWALNLFNLMTSDETLSLLDRSHLWVISGLILIFIAYFFFSKKYTKLTKVVELEEPQKPILVLCLMTIVALIMISPNIALFRTAFEKNYFKYFLRPSVAFGQAKEVYYKKWAGGVDLIDYINKNVPPKSTFDTNIAYFILPIVVDQHMPVYHTRAQVDHIQLYDSKTTLLERLEILNKYKIEYMVVKRPKTGGPVFNEHPEYFSQLFEDTHFVYKVNTEQVAKDLPNLKIKD